MVNGLVSLYLYCKKNIAFSSVVLDQSNEIPHVVQIMIMICYMDEWYVSMSQYYFLLLASMLDMFL